MPKQNLLSEMELENYRGFKRYKIKNLSRVNLLVGKNNCGKTCLLEAIQLLASGEDPLMIARTAWQRGEFASLPEESDKFRRETFAEISHFFHGHKLEPGVYFSLRSQSKWGDLKVLVSDASELENQRDLFSERTVSALDESFEVGQVFALQFLRKPNHTERKLPAFPVSDRGALLLDVYGHRRGIPWTHHPGANVQFITPDSLLPGSMSEMWDQVILDGREEEVINAMQILEPKLNKIFFLTSERSYRFRGRSGVLLSFEGEKQRVPLGSYGEGMRRFLALSLSLIRTSNGVLLVDEIDTGLHWSIMEDMWRLVINAAKQSKVQVFATTHSMDCLTGLASLCKKDPQWGTQVSLQKIDPDLDEAVALDSEQINIAVQQKIEVR